MWYNLKCLLPLSITFSNLTYVGVTDCNGLVNLFSCLVAKSLVNLKRLSISKCTKMRYIVAAPEGDADEENEEEIIFNQLNYLELYNLPKLTNFHSGKCILKYVCLERLDIEGCPEVKKIPNETVSTPKLPFVTTSSNYRRRRLWLHSSHQVCIFVALQPC